MSRRSNRWVTLKSYLAATESKGPRERPRGEYSLYDQPDGDTLTLLSILREGGAISRVACIPDWRLCIYSRRDGGIRMLKDTGKACRHSPGEPLVVSIQAGIIVTAATGVWHGFKEDAKLWLPPGFVQLLDECRRKRKRFVICNFGLYGASASGAFGLYATSASGIGHSNGLILDLRNRVAERYEPAGRHSDAGDRLDATIERLLLAKLPKGWSYIGTRVAAPQRGPQAHADSYAGLCVTFSLAMMLLRLLNPDRSAAEIQKYMLRGSKSMQRSRILRLNKYMVERLQSHPRGSL